MSLEWSSLPLLPLRCVLEHLSVKDALSAMSTCRHWRSAILLYEGNKETLKLRIKYLEKNLFLTRMFKRNTRKLHIYIGPSQDELKKFINFVLPEFFDTVNLQEVLFIGPKYLQLDGNSTYVVNLNRIITESFIFKHFRCLQKLAFFGCKMDTANHNSEKYTHKQVEFYARSLTFNTAPLPKDAILTRFNTRLMTLSTLRHIVTDYEYVNTEALETLSHLSLFNQLTLNITKKWRPLVPIDWQRLRHFYPNQLQVSLNIIALPQNMLDKVVDEVLVEDLTLVSLKVLFCETLCTRLLSHVAYTHRTTLRELVWVDILRDSKPPKTDRNMYHCGENPFILLCWQCEHLKRLVIHGHWVWEYDLVGMARLRPKLAKLEVSAVFMDGVYGGRNASHVRDFDGDFYAEMESFKAWGVRDMCWRLPRGLRARSSWHHRAEYALKEAASVLPSE